MFLLVTAFAQTIDLGQHLFFNNESEIVIAVDAALAVRKLDSPYVMFMVYMGSKHEKNVSVHRDSVVMIYKGQEYKMPSVEEWRKEYNGATNDVNLYARLGKDALSQSQMRFWDYKWNYDYFPILGAGPLPSDQLSMSGSIGVKTKFYFRNPGFQKGDELAIMVKDQKDPKLTGFCGVLLDPK
jgi:hypothetical protein